MEYLAIVMGNLNLAARFFVIAGFLGSIEGALKMFSINGRRISRRLFFIFLAIFIISVLILIFCPTEREATHLFRGMQ